MNFVTLFVLLLPVATCFINQTYYQEGPACPPPPPGLVSDASSGCFDNNIHTTGCRHYQTACASGQMLAIQLNTESSQPNCLRSTWTWECTNDTLVFCTGQLWCDALAICNDTAVSCSCQNNLTNVADGSCGCLEGTYMSTLSGTGNLDFNHICLEVSRPCNASFEFELSPSTPTSDRVCVPAPTTTTTSTYTPTTAPTTTATPIHTPTTTLTTVDTAEKGTSNNIPAWLIAVIVLAVLLSFVLVVAIIIFWKRTNNNQQVHSTDFA